MLLITVTLVVGLTGIVQSVAAQGEERAERLEERRAIAFHRVLSSGDPDSVVAFLQANLAPPMWERRNMEEWRGMAERLVRDLGSTQVGGVMIRQPHTLTLRLVPQDGGMPASLEFEFEPQSPHRIAGLGVARGGPGGPGRGPGGSPLPPLELPTNTDHAAIRDALARYLQTLADDDRFSGAVLVAHRGDVLFSAAHGMASKRFKVPNRLDTRFDIGSINKEFTKVAVAQLLAQGKLSLDDRLIEYLPDYPNRSAAERITIGHLVDHTSGLGDIFSDKFFRSSRALYRTPGDYFGLFANEPLLFEPGTGREYSNAGYIVLGAVIEVVTGQTYHDYIHRHVFDPAGMTATGFFPRDGLEPNVAEGYTRMTPDGRGDEWQSNMFRLPIVGNAAGSAQSTVEDLWRFDTALREHKLLPPEYTRWVFGEDLPSGGGAHDMSRFGGELGIAGGGPGVSAVLESDGDLVVVVLSNYDPPTAERVGIQLYRALKKQ